MEIGDVITLIVSAVVALLAALGILIPAWVRLNRENAELRSDFKANSREIERQAKEIERLWNTRASREDIDELRLSLATLAEDKIALGRMEAHYQNIEKSFDKLEKRIDIFVNHTH